MKKFYPFILTAFSIFGVSAQEEETLLSIGILPVQSTPSHAEQFRENVRDQIINAFASKSRFTVIDRSRLDEVLREQNIQMREEFIDGKIVEQGKSIGAQYLVGANISELIYTPVPTSKTRYLTDKATGKVYAQPWIRLDLQISLVISVQIIDVTTSVLKSSKIITSNLLFEGTETSRPQPSVPMVLSNVKNLQGYLKAWINSVFPVVMKVVGVEGHFEKGRRKGLPQYLLTTGGAEMDMQHSKSILGNTSSELEVYESAYITVDGKNIHRPRVLGKVLVEKVEGSLAVCKIKDGHEQIQDALDAGKPLHLRIIEY